jgi:DNA-binding NarL/FixJ family response regulator
MILLSGESESDPSEKRGLAGSSVRQATDSNQFIKAAELRPEIVLLDIGMPTLSGIEAAKHIRRASPHSKIIFVTQVTDADIRAEALVTGAEAYVLKESASSTLLTTIETALGYSHYSPTARD